MSAENLPPLPDGRYLWTTRLEPKWDEDSILIRATRSDLDKALESLGLVAIKADRIGPKLDGLRAERDAAIAAKQAAEGKYRFVHGQREAAWLELAKMRPVVESVRKLLRGSLHLEAWERLKADVSALDAGEEPKLCKRHGIPLHDFDRCDRCELEQLRSALARAEEEKAHLERRLRTFSDEEAETVDRLRSELQAEKARADGPPGGFVDESCARCDHPNHHGHPCMNCPYTRRCAAHVPRIVPGSDGDAEPKAEAMPEARIGEIETAACNADGVRGIRSADAFEIIAALRVANARIADQDAHIRKLTDRLSAHQQEEQRLEERVRLLEGYLADAKTRCGELETSDALARARCAELEAELAEARKR